MMSWREFFRELRSKRREPKKPVDIITHNDGYYITPETWLRMAAAMAKTADELRQEYPRDAVRAMTKFTLYLARRQKIMARHAWVLPS